MTRGENSRQQITTQTKPQRKDIPITGNISLFIRHRHTASDLDTSSLRELRQDAIDLLANLALPMLFLVDVSGLFRGLPLIEILRPALTRGRQALDIWFCAHYFLYLLQTQKTLLDLTQVLEKLHKCQQSKAYIESRNPTTTQCKIYVLCSSHTVRLARNPNESFPSLPTSGENFPADTAGTLTKTKKNCARCISANDVPWRLAGYR